MSEIFNEKDTFLVYSSNSTRLFIIIIVTVFHKLYVLFLKCGGCLFFYVKHGGLFLAIGYK